MSATKKMCTFKKKKTGRKILCLKNQCLKTDISYRILCPRKKTIELAFIELFFVLFCVELTLFCEELTDFEGSKGVAFCVELISCTEGNPCWSYNL